GAVAFGNPARKRLYGVVLLATLAFLVWQALATWRDNHGILVNMSPSLPNWAFLLERKAPAQRGDLIFFRAPASDILAATFGEGEHLLGKHVHGVGGDVVTRDGAAFYVNGELAAVAKSETKRGELLEAGPTGIIPHGCYFVATDHKDSFDSRYALIGWICRDRIVGTGTPIL
ncbi:S26 family signal peptidase, partial [Aquamicrobium sp.]|uniref:S26 family signal peptidase n=1 Tax=Aquamicrobium sp. TaxID=1872579 RepID=UPI0025847A2E